MQLKTLQRTGNQLSSPRCQLRVLGDPACIGPIQTFDESLAAQNEYPLQRQTLRTLQVNLGKVCNQTCSHCHVDAGPDRRENMTRETAEQIVDFLKRSSVDTLDITGGAPEMNSSFTWLVEQARSLDLQVIDRCNLTILLAPGFTHLTNCGVAIKFGLTVSTPLPTCRSVAISTTCCGTGT
jgi:radical SAM/Cys-rich protein